MSAQVGASVVETVGPSSLPLRSVTDAALLSSGFRPFFLLGSLWAGLSILFWLPLFFGDLDTASSFAPIDWHIHELLFGYLSAIVTGFLLTAIPNWTGRVPVRGAPLLGLILLWMAGRAAVFSSAQIGWLAAAFIDCVYLAVVGVVAAREILAARRSRSQFIVLLPVSGLLAANILFHTEAHLFGLSDVGRRLGLAAAILMISLIGGRIIPSFTRNWLLREDERRLPVSFNRLDAVAIAVSVFALGCWTIFPEFAATGVAMAMAAVLQGTRLARWAGDRVTRNPLLLVLHLGYAFVPVGFALAALGTMAPALVSPAAATHAFGAGAIGTMTLAVMIRATLGHTGHELRVGVTGAALFAAVILAALLRIMATFFPVETALILVSAALWAVAFLGFAFLFGAMLVRQGA